DHERGPRPAAPARYLDFVDQLFNSGQLDGEKRDFLRRGLAGGDAPRPTARPSSAGIKYADAALRRAAAAGLVRNVGGRTIIGCGPETVHWGFLWGASEPIAIVAPGAEVTIDTMSHARLLARQRDPVGSSLV